MQEFIQSVVDEIGVPESTARSATGAVFKLLEKHVDQRDFSVLMGKLPGSDALLAAAPDDGAAGGLGRLMGAAASALGGETGTKVEAATMLKRAGLGLDDARPFLSMLLDFTRKQAGNELVDKLIGQMPQIKSLLG